VLRDRDIESRAQTIDYFISAAEYCRQNNCFHTVMEIVSALSCQPVYRLARTWELVENVAALHSLRTLCSSEKNFYALRVAMRNAELPCFPYVGTFFSDLLFIEQGNPTTIYGMINFHKLRRMTDVISTIQKYQSVSFSSFVSLEAAQAMLRNIVLVSEDDLFKRSWAVEA
jgi:son of sevenless-like protein